MSEDTISYMDNITNIIHNNKDDINNDDINNDDNDKDDIIDDDGGEDDIISCDDNELDSYIIHGREYGTKVKYISSNGDIVTFILKNLCEGECSVGYCSHCAGWKLYNIPDDCFETKHRKHIKKGDARVYYHPPIYHQEEADQIIDNLRWLHKYKFHSVEYPT